MLVVSFVEVLLSKNLSCSPCVVKYDRWLSMLVCCVSLVASTLFVFHSSSFYHFRLYAFSIFGLGQDTMSLQRPSVIGITLVDIVQLQRPGVTGRSGSIKY